MVVGLLAQVLQPVPMYSLMAYQRIGLVMPGIYTVVLWMGVIWVQ
jgi:hypothetical protein